MEFKRHLKKGIWAFADKALPAIWGVCNIFLVQKVLPASEYASLANILQLYYIVTTLCTAFAFQPLIKYAAELDDPSDEIAASLLFSIAFNLVVLGGLFLFKDPIISVLDKNHQGNLSSLFGYLPVMVAGAWYRNFAVAILQARYQVQRIFFIDAAYFLGVPALIVAAQQMGVYGTAKDVLLLNTVALFASTVISLPATWSMVRKPMRLRKEAFGHVYHFGKYSFWGTSMYSFFAQADVFFVSSYAGLLAVAPYSIAKTFTRLFDMLTQVIQMFLIPFSAKASASGDRDTLLVVAEKTICFSTILFLPVFLLLVFFPVPLLHVIYHGKYDNAAPILRTLGFLILAVPWNAVIASYFVGSGRVREGFYSNIFLMIVALILYVIFTPLFGAVGTAIGLVSSFYIVTGALVLYMRSSLPLSPSRIAARVVDIWSFGKGILARSSSKSS